MAEQMSFITDIVAVDYLTVSTFNERDFNTMVAWGWDEQTNGERVKRCQRMQYQGHQQEKVGGSFFWGSGSQGNLAHYLIQASGAFSDRFASMFFNSDWRDVKVTRIDLQVTKSRPSWYKSRHLVDWLRDAEWRGKARKTVLVDGDGDDTVYIGSRKTDRFIRLYVKDKDWLRFEVEYKSDRAESVAALMFAHDYRKASSGIVHRELLNLPDHPVITGFASAIRDAPLIPIVQKSESNTFKWFVKTVIPALEKLLNDHDMSSRTERILYDILERNRGESQ